MVTKRSFDRDNGAQRCFTISATPISAPRIFGRAILNYERALALERHHPESQANLLIARDEARALEMQPTWLERHLQFASLNQYSDRGVGCVLGGIFCITGLIFARRRSARMILLSILSFSICGAAVFATYKVANETKGWRL